MFFFRTRATVKLEQNAIPVDDDSDNEESERLREILLKYSARLRQDFMKRKFILDEPKRQRSYLSPADMEIAFNEVAHTYLLPRKKKIFNTSVTAFCKGAIHSSDFNPAKVVRNIALDSDGTDDEYDMHAYKVIEWKYSAVFGSLFHAIIEYFFDKVVNNCPHRACRMQAYAHGAYRDWLVDETNTYNITTDIFSQACQPHTSFANKPVMPCMYALEYFDILTEIVTDDENFAAFIGNNPRYNIDHRLYKKELLNTMEKAFDLERSKLKSTVLRYRTNKGQSYETAIDNIIHNYFGAGTYLGDLTAHLKSFRSVLSHLPLRECCDIRPEYIVYSEKHGLAGSVDLTMRMRFDPLHLLVYDWKTCKRIFSSFYRAGTQTNQLSDYSCQLHTYANLIRERNQRFKIDLFVVNVTAQDCCIYKTKSYLQCHCHDIFKQFKAPLSNYISV